jgi:hypothetical protein
MAWEKPNRRRYVYSARRDPITYVDHEFKSGSWDFIESLCGWRPSRAFIIGRSKLDAESIRYMAEWKNRK